MLRDDRVARVGVMFGTGTTIDDADDTFLRIIGRTRDDLDAGRIDWAAMTPDEYRDVDRDATDQARTTGTLTVPYQKALLRPDGTRVPILVCGAFLSEDHRRWIGYVVDLSARSDVDDTGGPPSSTTDRDPHEFLSRLVEGLVRERTRILAMIDSASSLMLAVDRDYRLLAVNEALQRRQYAITGRPMRIGEVQLSDDYPPDARAQFRHGCDEAFAGHRFTQRLVSAQADHAVHDYIYSPITDPTGEIVGATLEARDVTSQVQAEAALAASEARFRTIFDHSGDVGILTDADFVVTYVTPSIEPVLGWPAERAVGRSLPDLFALTTTDPPPDVALERVSGLGSSVVVTAPILDGRKRPRHVEMTLVNLVDDPAVGGYAGSVRDVTERRAADELLEHRRSLLRLAGRLAKVGGWSIDVATRRITLSDEVIDLLDLSPGVELDLPTAIGLSTPPSQAVLLAAVERSLEDGEPFDVHVEIETPRGRRVVAHLLGEAVVGADGRVVTVEGALADVTDRDEREHEVRHQAELLDNATDAIIERSVDGRITYWNQGAARLYGYERSEAIGKDLRDLVGADDGTFFGELRAGRTTVDSWSGRRRRIRKDGTPVWVDVHIDVLRDASGAPTGVLSIGSDVTTQVELEERLALAQKLESVGQLTGGIAHDFNNLLTVIIGGAELLATELRGDENLGPLASMVLAAAERGSQLTSRLLSFARRQTLQPTTVDLVELVDGVHDLLTRSIPEAISVEVAHEGERWPVSVDPGLFEASLMNVAINARDAMPDGGRLRISTSTTTLDTVAAAALPDVAPGSYVQVTVSDTGTGMTPEVASRAFDPFFTTKDVGKGSGLGLSMVYGFIRQSGGHVTMRSAPGEGTTVVLMLPRSDEPARRTTQPSPDGDLPTGDERILVVEDDALVRVHASRLLREFGYDVLTACDGSEAVDVLRSDEPIDLLFTDVVMPNGISGVELAARAGALRPGLRVLFTSGYTEHAMVLTGTIGSGSRLVTKPYRRDELARRVRDALDAEAPTETP